MLPNLEHINNYRSVIKIFIDQISIFFKFNVSPTGDSFRIFI
ncbi:hypothetical protein VCHA27O13_140132 [Vibrio chagasii]|nr:hypothetical protein VCHA27O13_140132 [Vibrio chagasii]